MARLERHPDDLVIVPSSLGDDAGLAGAAAWEAATKCRLSPVPVSPHVAEPPWPVLCLATVSMKAAARQRAVSVYKVLEAATKLQ